MAFDRRPSCRCMIFVILSMSLFGTAMSQEEFEHPWERVGKIAACKGKEEDAMCEYSADVIENNFLFEYSHDEQLKWDIKELLVKRGFAKADWMRRLVIKSRTGKVLNVNFLNLPDIFDGGVTPNDFPIKLFLQETWKGKCVGKDTVWCKGVRSTLYDACEGQKDSPEGCSYESLKLESDRLKDIVKEPFEGWCKEASGINSCHMKPKVHAVEACLGKMPGKTCMYSLAGPDDLYKGLCTGGMGGHALWCNGAKAVLTDACKGKVRGDKCEVGGEKPWKGWCGYGDQSLACMEAKAPAPMPKPQPPGGKPKPPPVSPPHGGLMNLAKDIKYTRALLDGVAAKLGVEPPKPPSPPTKPPSPPTKPPSPPSGRRRLPRPERPKPPGGPGSKSRRRSSGPGRRRRRARSSS